eukprot:m.135058 g.135058  ORF g.135058 m.135058 type:complete len:216 (-) comp9818_c0_seq1:988-1635(-)
MMTQHTTFSFVFLGQMTLDAELRHDLDATNTTIAAITREPNERNSHVRIFPHGVQCVDAETNSIIADINIFNVLLSGADSKYFVLLGRDSKASKRDEGDHTIFVFEANNKEDALRAASFLNVHSKVFMEALQDVRNNEEEQRLHGALENKFVSEKSDFNEKAEHDAADEFEQQAFTGFVEKPPTKNGRPSVVLHGEVHEIQRATRRSSHDYALKH